MPKQKLAHDGKAMPSLRSALRGLDGVVLVYEAVFETVWLHQWVSCHFRFWSVVDHAMPCYSMKMEVPGLADSLQQCLCVNSGVAFMQVMSWIQTQAANRAS